LKGQKGFLILEVLIAGLILSATVAATMYLFKLGFDYLGRANTSNMFALKLPQAVNLIQILDVESGEGTEDIGDGVTLKWAAKLLGRSKRTSAISESPQTSMYEFLLYGIDFRLSYKSETRDYKTNVFRHVSSATKQDSFF
jgi:hypothetical protein